ncbi:McrC family protein [Spirosoma montaniterrae]|uniref:Restriction endonuclease n=1 Tax=Spirosoma montaniterrae TaxID=1178516 RepID=A0A1P9WX93_9BACT|nr:restriction endonuclease [Spirosoma montaniterrae]AQG80007.1 restriction endonuclease [Spirosoma montaniterrae]
MPQLTVYENDRLVSGSAVAGLPFDGVPVDDLLFQQLRQLAFTLDGADSLFLVGIYKGVEYVQLRNYVGLLPVSNGVQLEILPNITDAANPRTTLLYMLRHLRQSPLRSLANARSAATSLPLWEVFVSSFLHTLDVLSRQGFQRAYIPVDSNERYWRGQFQPARQLRENAQHAERLAVRHDVLTASVPPNRVLKTTLLFLENRVQAESNKRRIRQHLWTLADVPPAESIAEDLRASQRQTRLFLRYEPALRWAKALLTEQGLGARTGRVDEMALLFPMERVFEDYVAHGLRTYWPNTGAVAVQEASAHLVDEHAGTPKFKLRPDIIVRQADRTLLFDTKWKRITGDRPGNGNYGIEQADLYQLYAYGKKYAASDLFLVYPANETFREPLPVFGYDAQTRLHVVPFSPTNPLAQEVEKLARYALES